MNIEAIIEEIRDAGEVKIDEYDFEKCFCALREMRGILDDCAAIGMLTAGFYSGVTHNEVCKRFADFNKIVISFRKKTDCTDGIYKSDILHNAKAT